MLMTESVDCGLWRKRKFVKRKEMGEGQRCKWDMQAEVQGPPGERGKSLEAGGEGGGQRRRSGYFRLR